MRADDLAQLLRTKRYPWRNETDLQNGLEDVLTEAELAFKREFVLAEDCRIDFLVDRVGLEVKVKGGLAAVMSQLQRYARSDQLDSLVLATTKSVHRELPQVIGGKPLSVAYLIHIA